MCKSKQTCQKPQELKVTPERCSPEQIRKCHGEVTAHPCVPAAGCRKPENLRAKPGDCSPEQIRKCHGDAAGHPCVEDQ
jgi:hypothetical protein